MTLGASPRSREHVLGPPLETQEFADKATVYELSRQILGLGARRDVNRVCEAHSPA